MREKSASAFPPVILEMQKKFVGSVRPIAAVTPRFFSDQCRSSCGNFAYATYLSYVGNAESPISGGYIASRTLEERYNGLLLGSSSKVELGTRPYELYVAARVHGVLTEAQYPSESMVNTPLLVEVLNEIGNTYRIELQDHQRDSERFFKIYQEARNMGSQAIQYFFGFYPKDISREQAREQLEAITPKGTFQGVHEYRKFAKIAHLLLRDGYPIEIGYDVGGKHSGDGVYEKAFRRDEIRGTHAAVVVGTYRDAQNTLYYKVQNSHAHAPILYYSENYMQWHFNSAYFFTPPELAAAIDRFL